MKLAALYRPDADIPSLHVAAGNGFAAVDELAAASRRSRPERPARRRRALLPGRGSRRPAP